MNLIPQLPRLAIFSGEAAKGELTYEHWRFEVSGLQNDRVYAEPLILHAIRRSFHGKKAAEVVLHLGKDVCMQHDEDGQDIWKSVAVRQHSGTFLYCSTRDKRGYFQLSLPNRGFCGST